jgi:hypothetical protein
MSLFWGGGGSGWDPYGDFARTILDTWQKNDDLPISYREKGNKLIG